MRTRFNLEGMLAVEMFCTTDGKLLVNELAPRPHNSYHASERACVTSQFEQLVRAVCDLPLGDVEVVQPAAIANLLGDLWLEADGSAREPRFDKALAVPGVGLHLYEKHMPRKGRKMGHLSAVGRRADEAVESGAAGEGAALEFSSLRRQKTAADSDRDLSRFSFSVWRTVTSRCLRTSFRGRP